MSIEGRCAVCGDYGPLTFEHVPPKAAFNDRGVLLADLEHYFHQTDRNDPDQIRMRKRPRGVGGHTLCQKCNNDTGALYGAAYVDWAAQGMSYRLMMPAGTNLALPFHVLPGRIAKQVLCMFASACGPGLFSAERALTRYVLNRDARGIPDKYRLYCFIMAGDSSSARQSGVTGLFSGRTSHIFSEISFPPFGYILAIASEPVDSGLTDITGFTHSGFSEFRSIHLRLPVREVNSYFPGDFRTRDEWRHAIDYAKANAPER